MIAFLFLLWFVCSFCYWISHKNSYLEFSKIRVFVVALTVSKIWVQVANNQKKFNVFFVPFKSLWNSILHYLKRLKLMVTYFSWPIIIFRQTGAGGSLCRPTFYSQIILLPAFIYISYIYIYIYISTVVNHVYTLHNLHEGNINYCH